MNLPKTTSSPKTSDLFFSSRLVSTHWDTWVYYDHSIFYLYYLYEKDGHWTGFGVATSTDGVRWNDHGPALSASSRMVDYLGSGSVWKSPDFVQDQLYICNYSEWQQNAQGEKRQRIFFATSIDLIHWEKKPDIVFDIDERYYEPQGRWDCIYVIPREAGGYFGTWTGTSKGSVPLKGGIALGYSLDGLHWTALPPPEVQPAMSESGAIHQFGSDFYAMFGTFENILQMHAYHSKSLFGPYHVCPKNEFFLSKYTYFSRFFSFHGDILVNHHAITKMKSNTNFYHCYLAPLKRPEIIDGSLYLTYFEAIDGLKSNAKVKTSDWNKDALFIIEGQCKDTFRMTLIHPSGKVEIRCTPPTLTITEGEEICTYSNENAQGGGHLIRILLKDSVFEIYFDRFYIASYSMNGSFSGQMLSDQFMTVWEI